MKKLLIISATICLLTTFVSKQSLSQTVFGLGNLGLNIGLGINNADEDVFLPSLNVAADYGFLNGIIDGKGCISGGGYLGLAHGSKTINGIKIKHGEWQIGTRGALHYQFVPHLDTYGCLSVGYLHWKHETEDLHLDFEEGNFKLFVTVGARYMFGNVGVYSEISPWGDVAFFKLGVTFIF